MGTLIEGVDDHEGYALRRLPDGTLTGVWTGATRAFTAYLPACDCGWRSPHQHPPTDQGWEAAVEDWRAEHAVPLLERPADRRRQELARVLSWLGDQADRLQDPAILTRVRAGIDRAHQVAEELQRALEQAAFEREAGGDR